MRIPVFPQVSEAYPFSTDPPTISESDKSGWWGGPVISILVFAGLLLAPVSPAEVIHGYLQPATTYGAGHRGVDYRATVRQQVTAPVDGVVAYVGRINDRGVVTISAGDMVISMEPVEATVRVHEQVFAGQRIGITGIGGHCSLRCVHVGLRIDGNYVDPLVSRRRLLRS